ncbi:MAG: hypothetical protein KME29_15475 [Calothrix sp. FI2-JRJ7]|jgi:hypothetical protein|nr:hypothetical protein [Calothrix sp. FI2-JRJ7]
MKIGNRNIIMTNGYCYELTDTGMIPTIVIDVEDNVVLGHKWFEDIVSFGRFIKPQRIVVAELTEYRKDITEGLEPHVFTNRYYR